MALPAKLRHIGAGKLSPSRPTTRADHRMHEEWASFAPPHGPNARAAGRGIGAGTTAPRTLETVTDDVGTIHTFRAIPRF
jgi:S-adenosylmethionine:tRNA-ribosyltransferase-isomerase (queuine synthetase)